MSDLAKESRRKNREKAERLTGSDPHQQVDASDYRPSSEMHADRKTGAQPKNPRMFKKGGKVEGAKAKARADKAPRKGPKRAHRDDGGNVLEALSPAYALSKQKDALKAISPVASLKRGGKARTHKADGGSFVPTERFGFSPSTGSKLMGLKHGGPADSVSDGDLQGMRPKGGREARKHGGRADANWIKGAIKHPGALHRELNVADDKRIPERKIEKAEHSQNKLVAKRARLAETLRDMHKDKDCDGGREPRKSGGRAGKGKMNVNIVIGRDQPQPPAAMPIPLPPRPPMGGPQPAMGGAPMPPPGMPPGLPPGALPPGPPMGQPMPRKRGGRAYDAGSGSGKGRLEKAEHYG